jgi:hypothetical protein
MSVQNSAFYINALGTQRAVVLYDAGSTYVFDNRNHVIESSATNQFTQYSSNLVNSGYVPGQSWQVPMNPP